MSGVISVIFVGKPLCDNKFIPAGYKSDRPASSGAVAITQSSNVRGAGWRTPAIVLACGSMVLMLSIGTRQTFGLFLPPMTFDHGWSRETFGFAIALQNIVWGLGQPFAGAIADKFGA